MSRILSSAKLLTILSAFGFSMIETINFLFPRPQSSVLVWYVLDLHVLVLFYIGWLFLSTLEMFARP